MTRPVWAIPSRCTSLPLLTTLAASWPAGEPRGGIAFQDQRGRAGLGAITARLPAGKNLLLSRLAGSAFICAVRPATYCAVVNAAVPGFNPSAPAVTCILPDCPSFARTISIAFP